MKRIYKYTLILTERQWVTIAGNSEILSVDSQGDNIVLYAIVDTTRDGTSDYDIRIAGTGQTIEPFDKNDFVGTVKLQDGRFMFHVFARRRRY